jgi:hypothetical protein
VDFQIIGSIVNVVTIAVGRGIRERRRLNKTYGRGQWRKLEGLAVVRLDDATMHLAEIHWYEAHGIGKKEIKIKRLLEEAG